MHFIATCSKYPEFKFSCPELRRLRPVDSRKSTVVAFEGGYLDTQRMGYDEHEARAILTTIQRMRQTPPLYLDHIRVHVDEPKKEKK